MVTRLGGDDGWRFSDGNVLELEDWRRILEFVEDAIYV